MYGGRVFATATRNGGLYQLNRTRDGVRKRQLRFGNWKQKKAFSEDHAIPIGSPAAESISPAEEMLVRLSNTTGLNVACKNQNGVHQEEIVDEYPVQEELSGGKPVQEESGQQDVVELENTD